MLLASSLIISLFSGCAAQNSGSASAIEAKTYPFRIQREKEKEVEETEINLYFVNGGDIPYVALSEYMPFVGSLYEDKDINVPAAEYEITQPEKNHTMVQRTDNDAFMDINTEDDTIEFVDMDFFTAVPGSSIAKSIISMSDSGRGGISNLLQDAGAYERTGDSLIKFDLSEYMIDLVEKDGECYVPMQTVNDLLVSSLYMYVVFNGQEVIGCVYGGELIDEMYNAPTGVMSEEFALFNYNELRFMLDTFYGLKPEHDIDNFGDFFASTGLLMDLSGTDPVAFDKAIRRLTMKYFDDGHSGLLKTSYLAGKEEASEEGAFEMLNDVGSSSNSMMWESIRIKSIRQEYYPDREEFDAYNLDQYPWMYEEVGDTAIITFDVFSCDKKDYYKEGDFKNPSDTIELVAYAQQKITRKDSPIKNVVVDLSCNGGGAADAAVYLMAWLSNDNTAKVAIKDTLTGAQSICSYEADFTMDGEIDFLEDGLPSEISRYILTSQSSFSCGNLVPSALKGEPNITLIGRTSGGGSCVVRPCTTASGAIFAVSSSKQISYVRNGSMYNVDQGVDPDFFVNKFETMYDREKLVDFIHNLP